MLSRFANIVLVGVRVRVSVKRTFTGPTTLNYAYKNCIFYNNASESLLPEEVRLYFQWDYSIVA